MPEYKLIFKIFILFALFAAICADEPQVDGDTDKLEGESSSNPEIDPAEVIGGNPIETTHDETDPVPATLPQSGADVQGPETLPAKPVTGPNPETLPYSPDPETLPGKPVTLPQTRTTELKAVWKSTKKIKQEKSLVQVDFLTETVAPIGPTETTKGTGKTIWKTIRTLSSRGPTRTTRSKPIRTLSSREPTRTTRSKTIRTLSTTERTTPTRPSIKTRPSVKSTWDTTPEPTSDSSPKIDCSATLIIALAICGVVVNFI